MCKSITLLHCTLCFLRKRQQCLTSSQQQTKKEAIVEDTVNSGLSTAKTNGTVTTSKAVIDGYTDLLESITDQDAHHLVKLHQNNGSSSDGDIRPRTATSDSLCSVTSTDADTNTKLISGATENSKADETAKVQEADLPLHEIPQYINITDHSSPKKECKHSWFSFRSKKKSKKNETKAPTAELSNPVFDEKDVSEEQTDSINEVTDGAKEKLSHTDTINKASNCEHTKEEASYDEVAKVAVDEKVPTHNSTMLEHTQSTSVDSKPQETINSNHENTSN